MKIFLILIGTVFVFSTANAYSDDEKTFSITILYDNYVFSGDVKADWGFSCIVEGAEKTVLFDTGTAKDIFLRNIENLHINIRKVEIIVISHNHWDHTGNLFTIIEKYKNLTVYLPSSFLPPYVRKIEEKETKVVSRQDTIELCKNVFLTSELGDVIKEQSLVLFTKKGIVIITGCSHPGIVNIIKTVKQEFNQKIYLVLGGFHLLDESEESISIIVDEFKKEGVLKVGATHCTGDRAIEAFKKAYGSNYVQLGVGKNLKISQP